MQSLVQCCAKFALAVRSKIAVPSWKCLRVAKSFSESLNYLSLVLGTAAAKTFRFHSKKISAPLKVSEVQIFFRFCRLGGDSAKR